MSKKKITAPENGPEPMAYVGPTIVGVAKHGTVFNNGIPKKLQEAVAEKPLLGKLIVKLSDFAEAQKSIIRKKGVYYEAYKSI
jgi:hypothetical protein